MDYTFYNWARLLDVFPNTTETLKFRDYVEECKKWGYPLPVDDSEWEEDPIVVEGMKITEIDLSNQQLTDRAIGDLSKLPSTLKGLTLFGNNLSTFNVAALPPGLKELDLSRNRLIHLDLTRLPTSLANLNLKDNRLTFVDLTKLPRNLKTLWLSGNELVSVDLSQVPRCMNIIELSMNYLDDHHFSTMCYQGHCDEYENYGMMTNTTVLGKGEQRPMIA